MIYAVRVALIVFVLHITALLGTSFLFNAYGGSLAHEIGGQDAREYMELGEQLLEDGSYHVPGNPTPETWRPPGYPVFVAIVFALTNHSLEALLVMLALVGAATSGLIYLIGREVSLSHRFSQIATILFGISPAIIWIPPSGMGGDITFIFLFTAAVYLTLRIARSTQRWRVALAIGILLGSATLIRPLGLYFSFFVFASLYLSIRTLKKKQVIALTLLCLASFALVLMPWMWRNEVYAGHFSISSQFAFNPFYYNMASFNAGEQGTSLEREQQKLMRSIGATEVYSVINGFTYYDRLKSIESAFLLQNFFPYLVFHLYKTLPFFFGSGMNVIYATITNEIPSLHMPFFPTSSQNTASLFYRGSYGAVLHNLWYYWPATLERLVWLTLFLLAGIAPFVTTGRPRRFAIFSALFICAVTLLASPIAQPRYRIPAEPFIWLSATLALSYFYNLWKPSFSRKSSKEPT